MRGVGSPGFPGKRAMFGAAISTKKEDGVNIHLVSLEYSSRLVFTNKDILTVEFVFMVI